MDIDFKSNPFNSGHGLDIKFLLRNGVRNNISFTKI